MVSGSIRLCEKLGWDLSWCQVLYVASIRDIWHFVSAESSFLTPSGALGRQPRRVGIRPSRSGILLRGEAGDLAAGIRRRERVGDGDGVFEVDGQLKALRQRLVAHHCVVMLAKLRAVFPKPLLDAALAAYDCAVWVADEAGFWSTPTTG